MPRDRNVAVATDFQVPAAWAGKRIVLRFDAVHGGAEYWLNGVRLGSSENLFTSVEFDVTRAAKVGGTNHLALGIRVQTASETASFSSDYSRITTWAGSTARCECSPCRRYTFRHCTMKRFWTTPTVMPWCWRSKPR